MTNIYSVANLEEPKSFDLEMAMDTNPESLEKNLDLATQWRNIARSNRYFTGFTEIALYTGAVVNYLFNPQGYPDEVNNVFTGMLALLGIGHSIGILKSKKVFKRSHKEYQRRVNLIEERIEMLKQGNLESTL
ncbi:hypothetical protein HYT57_00635 [Candidatus Woesearchaeota archaeon]|nr:hypothetical protein [Candidatus Woesearchaeota archaeon]